MCDGVTNSKRFTLDTCGNQAYVISFYFLSGLTVVPRTLKSRQFTTQSCSQHMLPRRYLSSSGICCASTSNDGGSKDIPPGRKSRGSGNSVGGSSGGSTTGGSGGRGGSGRSGHLSCPKCGDPCTHVETFVCKFYKFCLLKQCKNCCIVV